MTTPERTTIKADDANSRDPMFLKWLEEHHVAPNWTFQVDVGEDDMVVHQYAKSPTGHKYLIFAFGSSEVAKDEPTTVPLTSPCPLVKAASPEEAV